jgi:hypothetical protein
VKKAISTARLRTGPGYRVPVYPVRLCGIYGQHSINLLFLVIGS